MSKVRVYELAREMGIDATVVEQRCRDLGILAEGHLTLLTSEDAIRVRTALKDMPTAGMTQKRIGSTVVRRRRRGERGRARAVEAQAAVASSPASSGPLDAPTAVVRRRVAAEAPAVTEPAVAEPVVAEPTVAEPEAAIAPPAEVVAEPAQPLPEPQDVAVEASPEGPTVAVSEPEAVETPAEAAVSVEAPVEEAPEPTAAVATGEPGLVDEAAPVERPAAAASSYSDHDAVNAPGARPEPESPKSLVKVVRRLDDELTKNLINEAQRRAERTAAPRRPGVGPSGPPGPRRPGVPAGAPGLGGPPPPNADTRRRKGKRTAGASRVAWERHKDKRFDDRASRMRGKRRGTKRTGRTMLQQATVPKASKRVVKMEETITVGELAGQLSVKAPEIIKALMDMGEMVTVNAVLDLDTVTLVAQEYEFTVENVAFDIDNYIPQVDEERVKAVPRDPVVTVMGHVDHGKTSLLDYVRKTRVAAGEAGGITQHVGAYKVPVKVAGKKRHVVFLDTPGHAAFTQMRARGAQVTDVVILVIAADDGVKPQTIEAINHAKAAGVPVVVAVNKCDKPEAQPEKVRQQLTEYGLVDEKWGGDTQFVNVSAKSGDGITELLEGVLLQADILELSAIENRPATGVVVEAELSRGRGPVATILIQEGTLRRGDIVVAGRATGRVRAMLDDRGRKLNSAGPATPIELLGLNEVPPPSERFFVVKDERDARQIVNHLSDKDREKRLAEERKRTSVSLENILEKMEAGEVKTLNLVIKSDVQGSLEALRHAFQKLKHPELEVRIIHDAVGAISEGDVNLAAASNAIIIGFNIRPEKNAKHLAEQESVDVKLYSVIYNAVDDVKAAMEGMLKPNVEERSLGKAAVRDTFSVPKLGTIAGCAVLQGKLVRNARARLVRDGRVITDTTIDSLRRFKENVTEVERGHECGVHLDRYNDVKIGDEIECYELIEVAQTLDL